MTAAAAFGALVRRKESPGGAGRGEALDGRRLCRLRRRWVVERTFAWLKTYRRIAARAEHYSFLYHGFAQLACLAIAVTSF
ncbi:MAG: transposase [Planctomycetaceae bacterium]|nr:transposase [Planctomycetaceae bacterium]